MRQRFGAVLLALGWFAGNASTATENYSSQLGSVSSSISLTPGSLSGTISWSGSARFTAATSSEISSYLGRGCTADALTKCGVLVLMFWVDGALVDQELGVSDATVTIDTTALCNGPHEFVTTAWTDEPQSRLIGVSQTTVQVNNGRAPMAISLGWNEIILAPGEQQSFRPVLRYTNGDEEMLTSGVVYLADSPSVVSVSSGGILTAVSSGVSIVTMKAQGRTATTRVIVDPPVGFPHFGKDGSILTQYNPKRSMFLRSIFGITPDEVRNEHGLGASLTASGINALTTGIYMNPADGGAADFNKWRAAWDSTWNANVDLARSLGVSLFLTGDDIAREPYELKNSIENAWSAGAIQYAFATAQASNLAIGVDMVDEVALLWGDTPTPSDGRWLNLQTPVPDSAFSRVMQVIHVSPSRIPVSWPAGGIASDTAIANWNGNAEFSDYISHYWDVQDFRDEYYFSGRSLKQIQKWMGDEALFRRLPYIKRNQPQIALISATGPFYTKIAAGASYAPGSDVLQRSGAGPEQIMGQIMFAAAAGMCGVRVYNYDTLEWRNQRATAPSGTTDLQTGISVDSPQWKAMALSFTTIRQLEPWLLQPRVSAVDMGVNIMTTARKGANGSLLMAVNMAETAQPVTARLAPYEGAENVAHVTRYELTTDGLIRRKLVLGSTDELTLQPGETVAWVFAAGSAQTARRPLK
jgi:hypothetical protein